MRYLAFASVVFTLIVLALLITMGVELDVMMAGIMKLYLASVVAGIIAFIIAVIMLVRSNKVAKIEKDKRDLLKAKKA